MSVAGLLLAPGAGSDRDHPALLAIEAAVAPLPVERHDFPYRRAGGRRPPDRPPVLIASVVEAATALAARQRATAGQLVLGGRSMGGRMWSMAVAEGLAAAGLVLVGYPLHPARRPEVLRVQHLPDLDVPCLFVSGTRDALGSPEELLAATATIRGPVAHHWVAGGRHDLRGADEEVAAVVAAWIATL